MTLVEAVSQYIEPSSSIHVAYSDARPNAALLEIVRQFVGRSPNFTLSTAGLVSVQHALVAKGLVRRLIASFVGDNYPSPAPHEAFRRAIGNKELEVESWSMYSLIARLMAGALGVDFFPVRSLAGSDMAKDLQPNGFAEVQNPFGDGLVGVVRALRPDVTLLQGVAADPAGNVVLAPPYGEGVWGSLAAKKGVIASVERVLSSDELIALNHLVKVPSHVVLAVCEVPFGSHPYGLYNPGVPGVSSYAADHDFLVDVRKRSSSSDAFNEWIDEWVLELQDHEAYLRRVGYRTLSRLRSEADPAYWEVELLKEEPQAPESPFDTERMVIAAAEELVDRINVGGLEAILAGVGYANLAAWLAERHLNTAGHQVALMAEIGMFGYTPRPGDPFIFSIRNFPTCIELTDVLSVLGTFVSGPATRCIGVLGAGQVDRQGNLNSTWTPDGDYIVGSGGANDIATAADEVLVTVKHDAERLVERVTYITCPGSNVSTIVTTEGVLRRINNEFVLVGYFEKGAESSEEAVRRIRSVTGWGLEALDSPVRIPAPSKADLATIRSFDPRRTFLR
jgi:acyl CoA:acetate/3-ketoacid CoA transferase alpha subunit/acyl CoA:acetate/3-ketoacid CoA transferase beta subunit